MYFVITKLQLQMNILLNKLSLYWKCQLLGWTGFVIVTFIFNGLIYLDYLEFIPFAISILILGLVFSHLLKLTIQKLGVLKKSFQMQVVSLAVLSIVFSIASTFIWINIMSKAGIWIIDEQNTLGETGFKRAYFFNLFPVLLTLSGWSLIYFLYHYVQGVRREERLKTQYQLQMIELEAKALRAQMNPHFIFNCLNSIKALIQADEKKHATDYLTTFAKLIRTLFQNSDKRQITLYDEIETCKLYLELESMRFSGKLKYNFTIDPLVDLKSVMVPALIIQPFIENAIWHGIVPKEDGGTIAISITSREEKIICEIDDNGIGRKMSLLNKPADHITHESKGVHLSQARLSLENVLHSISSTIETVDKYENEMATGTKVIITFTLL